VWLASACAMWLSTDLMATDNLDNTCPMLNVIPQTNLPDNYCSEFKDWKHVYNQGSILLYDMTFKNYLKIHLDIWNPCTALAPTQFPMASGQSPHCTPGFSTSQCWNQQLWIWFPLCSTPTPGNRCQWPNQTFEILKSSTPSFDNQHCAA